MPPEEGISEGPLRALFHRNVIEREHILRRNIWNEEHWKDEKADKNSDVHFMEVLWGFCEVSPGLR